ncbi:MAG: aminoacetone oxidase family FAD-binding enzyme, partial [Rhodobacteraceae bacterium]|nr:aminoacetone oxidase family FAD-binding enzyme [Paracoccaceae bacterium]
GATGFGYRVAEGFGLVVTETRPGLVPLTFAEQELAAIRPMAGVALPARVSCAKTSFEEPLLFTHRGLSGPAVLQISSYWREGGEIVADLLPGRDLAAEMAALRPEAGRQAVHNALSRFLPDKVAAWAVARAGLAGPLAAQSNAALGRLAQAVHRWRIRPVGSEGYRTAEVTLGGVDTAGLDARTMEAKSVPGLYFVGEVVDVTGWLGGYNFQWAWSSGWAAGQAA